MGNENHQSALGRVLGMLGVRAKIIIVLAVTLLVAVAVGLLGLHALTQTNAATQKLYHNNIASVSAMGDLRVAVFTTRQDAALHVISRDQASVAKYRKAVAADLQAFDAALQEYRASNPAAPATAIDAIDNQFAAYQKILEEEMLPAGDRGDVVAWERIRDEDVLPIMTELVPGLAAMEKVENEDAARAASTAESGYERSRTQAIVLLVAGIAIALSLGLLVAANIIGSLRRVKDVCEGLAEGDLTRNVALSSRDEVGQMGRALDSALGTLRQTVGTINESAVSLAGAAEEMSSVSAHISESAAQTSERAQSVSAAAEEISRSVDSVSSASNEMGASIQEIAHNANQAAAVAAEAVGIADATNVTVTKLGQSSAEVGNVLKTITSIAEQTNLLALNATIEAARAGEAGKGFAVVASEVKDLAQETARATEDIARRVEAIQADTTGAVDAIGRIATVIGRVSEFQTTIASAVEEQTATTSETNRSVADAAQGVQDIAENITSVADSAGLTSQGIGDAQATTQELARMSSELSALVGRFRY